MGRVKFLRVWTLVNTIEKFVLIYHKYLIGIILMILTIMFSFRGAYFFDTIYNLDRLLLRDILNIFAFGCLAMLAIHPIILFQMLNFSTFKDKESIDLLFLSFYMAIIGNLILLALTIEQIAMINIRSDSALAQNAIIIFGGFLLMNFTTFIIRIDFIKGHFLNKNEN